ncbi:class E sortase [Candidatus Gottesmanbacteria bacterium]|nr:class E sortase [Candidatus Gottesmanbacteria bacterium]
MLYRYVKHAPVTITLPVLPLISIFIGSFLLAWLIIPLTVQFVFYSSSSVVSPVDAEFASLAKIRDSTSGNTNVNSWLPPAPTGTVTQAIDEYRLTIPKVRINKATVKVGSNDLSQSLIHFGSTPLPGKSGNAVIFGHSILPVFYNPKNYLAIFSLLPTLKEGDEIFVEVDGVDYRYVVRSSRITDPNDITGLEQRFDNSYLTLVTCFPPGTYFMRLWLTAELAPFGKD